MSNHFAANEKVSVKQQIAAAEINLVAAFCQRLIAFGIITGNSIIC